MTDEHGPGHLLARIRHWQDRGQSPRGGAEYADMIAALREFLDRVATAVPDPAMSQRLTRDLSAWSRDLAGVAVGEEHQIFGRRFDLPGRGQTMAPMFVVTDRDERTVRGKVTFGQYFLGGGDAVHGGAIPLVFDEVMGPLANSGGRGSSRTAFLHTDYRMVVPVDTELDLEAWFVSETGRKRLLRAEIRNGGTLCAEAEGLFIGLHPHQP